MADGTPYRPRTLLRGKFVLIANKEGQQSAECTFCGKVLKHHHSTSSLSYHYKSKHPFTSTSSSQAGLCGDSWSNAYQPSMWSFVLRKTTADDEHEITKAFCLWTAQDLRPMSIVEDKGLSDVLNLATSNTDFKVPGRSTIMEEIKNLYASKSAEIQTSLAAANHVVLALNYWTSLANDSYLSGHAFFVNADWQLRYVTLGINYNKQQHATENIKEQVIGFMARWQLLEEGSDHCASECKGQ